jgi:putative hemolysin
MIVDVKVTTFAFVYDQLWKYLLLSYLILFNGVFAMYEMALVSASKARLETLSQKGNKRAKSILKLLLQPEKILSTIQVGITLIGIVSGAYGGIALSDDLALRPGPGCLDGALCG